jgi:hypothetical protein
MAAGAAAAPTLAATAPAAAAATAAGTTAATTAATAGTETLIGGVAADTLGKGVAVAGEKVAEGATASLANPGVVSGVQGGVIPGVSTVGSNAPAPMAYSTPQSLVQARLDAVTTGTPVTDAGVTTKGAADYASTSVTTGGAAKPPTVMGKVLKGVGDMSTMEKIATAGAVTGAAGAAHGIATAPGKPPPSQGQGTNPKFKYAPNRATIRRSMELAAAKRRKEGKSRFGATTGYSRRSLGGD